MHRCSGAHESNTDAANVKLENQIKRRDVPTIGCCKIMATDLNSILLYLLQPTDKFTE